MTMKKTQKQQLQRPDAGSLGAPAQGVLRTLRCTSLYHKPLFHGRRA
jgi:hypothetical protein